MSSLRWSAEQLAEYQKRSGQQTRPLEVPIFAPAVEQPKESKIERRFVQQLNDAGIAGWQRNYFFLPDRELELDFAWPPIKLAVEVQGMAHRIKGKWKLDIEKRALALLEGWRVLEVDGAAVRDGRALAWLQRLLTGP